MLESALAAAKERITELEAENARLRADMERLLAAAKKIEENWATIGWGYNPEFRDKLKAAIKQAEEG